MSAVDHPSHYGGDTTYEAIKVIEAWGFGEGFAAGNAIKYLSRAGKKNSSLELEDLDKGLWYFQRYVDLRRKIVAGASEQEIAQAFIDLVEDAVAGHDDGALTPEQETFLAAGKVVAEEYVKKDRPTGCDCEDCECKPKKTDPIIEIIKCSTMSGETVPMFKHRSGRLSSDGDER